MTPVRLLLRELPAQVGHVAVVTSGELVEHAYHRDRSSAIREAVAKWRWARLVRTFWR